MRQSIFRGLMQVANSKQRVWNAIEASAQDPKRPVRPEEVRAEVWMSPIHGSTGIVYFVHEFKPFRDDGIFGHPEIVAEVREINSRIRELTPVLNSPSVSNGVSVSPAVPIATMVKRNGNALYVFAVSMRNQESAVRIGLSEHRDGDVAVAGENRTLQVTGGHFDDRFDGYSVHIYKAGPAKLD